jgi:hypothetical protein
LSFTSLSASGERQAEPIHLELRRLAVVGVREDVAHFVSPGARSLGRVADRRRAAAGDRRFHFLLGHHAERPIFFLVTFVPQTAMVRLPSGAI